MLIAAVTDSGDLMSRIPERFEEGKYLLIVETDDGSVAAAYAAKEIPVMRFPEKIIEHNVEAVVSGVMTADVFEPVAAASITRFNGAGLTAQEAVHAAVYNMLPYITDHEGGTGCPSHGDHSEENCLHHHEHGQA